MADYNTSLFGSSGSSASSFLGLPLAQNTTANDLTARQMALLLQLQHRNKHFSLGATLKGVGKKSLNPVLWTFDKLMRPSYAVAGAVDAGLDPNLKNKDSLGAVFGAAAHGAKQGFLGREHKGFGQVLEHQGLIKGHRHLRGAAGMYLDMATDPTMLLSTAAAPVTGGGSVAAYTALKEAGAEAGSVALKQAAKHAAYDAGRHAMEGKASPIVAEILSHAGPNYAARHALAKQALKDAEHAAAEGVTGRQLPESWFATRHITHEAALAEEKRVTKTALQIRYGTPGHFAKTPITVAGKRVSPTIPKLLSIADRKIPLVSHLTDATGKRFIPGWKREELHALQLARQHYSEQAAGIQKDEITKIMEGGTMHPGLTKEIQALGHDDQLHALQMFERPLKRNKKLRWKAVIKTKDGKYIINDKYVQHLIKLGEAGDPMGITHAQAEFVRRFHNATQYLHARDMAAGVTYKGEHLGEQGRLYVPHLLDRNGEAFAPNQTAKNLLSESGFMKKRAKSKITLSEINQLVEKGKLPNAIETDPYKLLGHTSRARAEKQADMAMLRATEGIYGVKSRIMDEAKMGVAIKRDKAAGNKVRAALRQAANAEEHVQSKTELYAHHVESEFNSKIEAIHKKVRQVRAGRLDNVKHAELIDSANNEFDLAVAAKQKAIDAKVTKLTNAAKRARVEADQAEAVAERAIAKGNKSWITRATRMAHPKMELADKLEAALKDLPTTIPDAEMAALKEARTRKIEAGMGRMRGTKRGQITKLMNDVVKLTVERDTQLMQLANGKHPGLRAALEEPKLALKTAKEQLAAARKEQKNAKKALDFHARGKHNPAIKGLKEVPASVDEWGHSHYFPPEVADAITRLQRITSGDEHVVQGFARGYAKMLSIWKLLVTSVNPGYRFRNTGTDFWNMWVSGVPATSIPIYGAKAAQLMIRAKKGDLKAAHTILEAATHGVTAGLFQGDIQAVARYIRMAGEKYSIKNPPKAYIKFMQDFNRNAENWGRLTHYLYQREGRKLPAAEAAIKVKLAHFDYEDLTQFEQKIMKKIFPFYTWTRKNIPFQVKMIMQHPGRYAAFPKLANEMEYASGNDPNSEIPGYMADNFAIAFGKNKYFNPQFGISDLAPLQGPGQAYDRVKSMITPAAKVPIELMTNKSLFSGQPIVDDKHPRTPVNSVGAALLSLLPGSNVGQTTRNGVSGPGANPYYAYLLGQIPALRTATISTGGIKGKQAGTNSLLSYLGGISTTSVDPEAQKSFITQDAQAQADRTIQGLRDAGILPPAKKRKKTKKDLFIQSQVFGK